MVIENQQIVAFTDAASTKLTEVLKEQDAEGSYLRIAATQNPSGGVEYVFGLEEEPGEEDLTIEAGGVRALVDEDSVPLLDGSSIDYVEGFQRSGFVISNPNFAGGGGCACGGGGCGCSGG